MKIVRDHVRQKHHQPVARKRVISFLILLVLFISVFGAPVFAQEGGPIQVIEGRLQDGQSHFYTLPELEMLQKVYVLVESTSGNLDPFVALADSDLDRERLSTEFSGISPRPSRKGATH